MWIFLWVSLWVFLDLLTKYLAQTFLWEKISLIGDFLYLSYFENSWIAFSIPIEWILLKILTIWGIWVIFWYFLFHEQNKQKTIIAWSYILVLSWAIGNAYERIVYGKVIDFIGVKYFSVMNLADIFLFTWVMLYLYFYLSNQHHDKKW